MIDWTDEKHLRLKTMWEQGYRRQAIAAEIGCTPNAVSGKVHRLGYKRILSVEQRDAIDTPPAPEIEPQSPPEIAPQSPPEIAPQSPPEIIPLPQVEPVLPPPVAKLRPRPVLVPIALPIVQTVERITISHIGQKVISPRAKQWIHRGARECAYPVGSPDRPAYQESCGNTAVLGKPYCSGHLSVMYPERKAKEAFYREAKRSARA